MIEKYNHVEIEGRNFVSDPYFEAWDNNVWEKGSPGKYTRKKENGKTYLYIRGMGGISQSIVLPKESSGESALPPYYSLSFDYEVKNRASVSLILTYFSGGNERDKKEIPLPDKKEWCPHELLLNVLENDTEIKLEFYAGKSAGNKGINLTAIDMQLHIGGFSPESIVFDNKNIPADKPHLRLNYGRKHILNIKPSDDSAWRDLGCLLKWNSSDTPASNYPISFEPKLETVQSLKKREVSGLFPA